MTMSAYTFSAIFSDRIAETYFSTLFRCHLCFERRFQLRRPLPEPLPPPFPIRGACLERKMAGVNLQPVFSHHLLLVILLLSPLFPSSNAQCSEDTCTRGCFPGELHISQKHFLSPSPLHLLAVIWERDLCLFYAQLSNWISRAEGCGLSLQAPPRWDRTLSAELQWEQASWYWSAALELWQAEAINFGVPLQQEGVLYMQIVISPKWCGYERIEIRIPIKQDLMLQRVLAII